MLGLAGMQAHDRECAALVLLDRCDRRADLPRCAISALVAIVLEERSLHGVQFACVFRVGGFGQPFDGGDLGALGCERQRQAGVDSASVDQDSTCPALPVVATFFAAGQLQGFPQASSREVRVSSESVFDCPFTFNVIAWVFDGVSAAESFGNPTAMPAEMTPAVCMKRRRLNSK